MVKTVTEEDPGLLAHKLRRLRAATINPETGKPFSYEAIARSICESQGDPRAISGSYIWQLTNSRKDDPGVKKLGMLAEFFGVSPSYLIDGEQWAHLEPDIELLQALRNPKIRSIAFRASSASDSSLNAVDALLKHIEDAERGLQGGSDNESPGE